MNGFWHKAASAKWGSPQAAFQLDERHVRRWLSVVVAIAVLLRVSAALFMGDRVEDLPGIYDQISYDRLAQNVVAGNGFSFDVDWWPNTRAGEPTAHWSYLATLYLAGVYKLVGHHPLVARLIQAVATGVLMPLLTYRLAVRLRGPVVGLLAAGVSAVYIYFFYYGAALMSEPLFFVAILGALNLALDVAARPALGRGAALGMVTGLAVLARQTFLAFVPFLVGWLVWAGRGRIRLWHVCVPLVVLALMILPWTVRNYVAFGEFVLVNTNAGYVFFWGNHPVHGTNFISLLGPEHPSYGELIPAELRGLNEAALERALLRAGLGFVADAPIRYVLLSLSRLKDYFLFWPKATSSTLSNISRVGSFGVCLPFMVYGVILSIRSAWRTEGDLATPERRAELVLLLLFVAVYSGIHLLSWAYVRYRLPVDTVLVIFAALGIDDLGRRFVHWRPWGASGRHTREGSAGH